MPYFVWFGISGLLLLYAAGIVMFLAKKKKQVHLRRYHPMLGGVGAIFLAVHAIWPNLSRLGRPSLMALIGLIAIAGVYFGIYAISRARKTRDKKWRQIHWKVELVALILATFHALWFIARILGR